jgi:hypothetical protein
LERGLAGQNARRDLSLLPQNSKPSIGPRFGRFQNSAQRRKYSPTPRAGIKRATSPARSDSCRKGLGGARAGQESRRLYKKLLLFSFACAFIGSLAGAGVFYVTNIYLPVADLQEINLKTIAAIHCDPETCDASGIDNVWEFSPSDYVVDKATPFFLNVDEPAADLSSNEVVSGGYWVLAYLRKDVALPPLGTSFRMKKSELYLVRIDGPPGVQITIQQSLPALPSANISTVIDLAPPQSAASVCIVCCASRA